MVSLCLLPGHFCCATGRQTGHQTGASTCPCSPRLSHSLLAVPETPGLLHMAIIPIIPTTLPQVLLPTHTTQYQLRDSELGQKHADKIGVHYSDFIPHLLSLRREILSRTGLKEQIQIYFLKGKNCVFTSDQFLDLPQHHIAEIEHWVLTHSASDSVFFKDLWQQLHWLRIKVKIFASDHSALKYTYNRKKTPNKQTQKCQKTPTTPPPPKTIKNPTPTLSFTTTRKNWIHISIIHKLGEIIQFLSRHIHIFSLSKKSDQWI